MRTALAWIALPAGLLAWGFLAADIDKLKPIGPERDKVDEGKKDQPRAEMGEPGKDDEAEHEKIHQKLAEEGQANLKEIARLMEKVRDNLSRKETGDRTQSDEREIVKKLQDLIEKLDKG